MIDSAPLTGQQMPKALAIDALIDQFKPGMEIYIAGAGGESPALIDALRARPDAARGVRFTSVGIPGANRFCYADLHPSARLRSFFLSPEQRAAFSAEKLDLLPLNYSAISQYLERTSFDLVLFQGLPNERGYGLSIAADFTVAALRRARSSAVFVNPNLPHTSAPTVAFGDVRYEVTAAAELPHYHPGELSSAYAVLGEVIAGAIPNSATLQLGPGKIQGAVARALHNHRDLRIHSGMVSDPLIALVMSGAIAAPRSSSPPIITGVALGSAKLYELLAEPSLARFEPVSYTHSPLNLAALPDLVAVNAVVEVDLTGQVNAEMVRGQQVSGAGGIADFVLGARLSWGGRSILATPATAADGALSRIVPSLAQGTPVTVTRAEVDCIATEFGIARLRGLSLDQRAQALIAIADPRFRYVLTKAWREQRKKW